MGYSSSSGGFPYAECDIFRVMRYLLAIVLPPVAVLLCGKPFHKRGQALPVDISRKRGDWDLRRKEKPRKAETVTSSA